MNEKVSTGRIVQRFLSAAIVLGLFLFLPAGTFKWIEAWGFILIYLAWALILLVWLKKHSPALLEKRGSTKLPSRSWDRVFLFVSTFFFAIMFITYGLDSVRFGWSNLPVFVEVIGFLGIVFSLYVVSLTMKENPYLARIVEIQEGQEVISTGPYKSVRHPMYAAFIVMIFGMSLALGSLYSLIPATLVVITIIIRTVLEDKTLHKELAGYADYANKVKYKLIPGVW